MAHSHTSHDTLELAPRAATVASISFEGGKARWPPIPFRGMQPKPEGLPLRTDKVKAARVFGSIVSLQMGQLERSLSPGYPLLALLDLADWSAPFGS